MNSITEVRSRKVRKIIKLEAKAEKFQARYDSAHSKIAHLGEKAASLRNQATALELTLTGGQLGELRRVRIMNGNGVWGSH